MGRPCITAEQARVLASLLASLSEAWDAFNPGARFSTVVSGLLRIFGLDGFCDDGYGVLIPVSYAWRPAFLVLHYAGSYAGTSS